MHTSHDWTAVIPLRNGSRGLPGKNTRPLAGVPLYRHSVEAALRAGASRVLITTDIPQILQGQEPDRVRVMERPAQLCTDDTPMAPVLAHALEQEDVHGTVVLLQATSPLRTTGDIHKALDVLAGGDFDLVLGVAEADRGILKWGTLEQDRFLPVSRVEYCFSNRQSLPAVYRPNGALYAMDAAWFRRNRSFGTDRIGVVIMPAERSHDIDSMADFDLCERLMTHLKDQRQ